MKRESTAHAVLLPEDRNFKLMGKTMKQRKNIKSRKGPQSLYMKMLQSLRNSHTSEYSRVLREETRGIILGYD